MLNVCYYEGNITCDSLKTFSRDDAFDLKKSNQPWSMSVKLCNEIEYFR